VEISIIATQSYSVFLGMCW